MTNYSFVMFQTERKAFRATAAFPTHQEAIDAATEALLRGREYVLDANGNPAALVHWGKGTPFSPDAMIEVRDLDEDTDTVEIYDPDQVYTSDWYAIALRLAELDPSWPPHLVEIQRLREKAKELIAKFDVVIVDPETS